MGAEDSAHVPVCDASRRRHQSGVVSRLLRPFRTRLPGHLRGIASCDPRNTSANFRIRHLWPAEVGIVGQAYGLVAAIHLHGVVLLAYMHTLPSRTVRITGSQFRSLIPS